MNEITDCPHPRLADLFRGSLPYAEVEPLARHLEVCPVCAGADWSGIDDPLAESVRGQERPVDGPEQPDIDRLIGSLRRLGSFPMDGTEADGGGRVRPVLAGLSPSDTIRGAGEALIPSRPEELGRIGAYRIVARLGSGSMGVVYLARQARPDRLVALKVVATGSRTGSDRSARFRAEAEVAARLSHPKVITVFEAGESEGVLYFAMEYAEGGSLTAALAHTALPPREAAVLIAALARGVAYAHGRGVIHRDLKPSNVLLTADGTPKVGDFGVAKCLDPQPGRDAGIETETGTVLGTPAYMAPEQAVGADAGPLADVYGLGAILYECLAGRPPFKAATVLETLDQVRSLAPIRLRQLQPGVPRDLETICLKCLEKAPARRYSSVGALADDLARFLGGRPIRARPIRSWEQAWKWVCRRPAPAALLAGGVLSATGLVVGVVVHNARLQKEVEQTQARESETLRAREVSAVRYQAARETLSRMLGRLNAPHLADLPRVMELRQHLLEDALAFYQTALGHEDDPDPVIRRDTAYAHADMGAIQSLLGRPGPSGENFRRALALLEDLPGEYRDEPGCLLKRGVCHSYLGNRARDGAQYAEAERHFRAELDLAEQLDRREPGNADWQNERARAEHHLGQLFHVSGRLADAVEHYLQAVAIRKSLSVSHPEVDRYQAQLAETYVNLGAVYSQQHLAGEARAVSAAAIALLRPLYVRHSQNTDYGLSLAAACINAGNFARNAREYDEALKLHNEAVRLSDAILRQEPSYVIARTRAYTAHGARAQTFEALGRWPEVANDLGRACELQPEAPDGWVTRVNRTSALARAGDHARAFAEVQALRSDPKVSGDGIYILAAAGAISAGSASKDSQLTPERRGSLTERYADEAVGLLRELHRRGYFRDAGNADALTTDLDLQAIRARPAFQELLREVKRDR